MLGAISDDFGEAKSIKKSMNNSIDFLIDFACHLELILEGICSNFRKNGSSHAMFRPDESIGPASEIEGLGPCWMSQKRPNSVQFFH